MKKTVAALLAATLTLSLLAGCGGKTDPTPTPEADPTPSAQTQAEKTVLKVGASPTPHAEILENVVKDLLAKENIELQVVTYDDYVLPNTHVEDGTIDANYFQHITYMNAFNADNGTHLVNVANIHYEPFGIYAGKSSALADLPEKATIAIPNDPTNGGRALLLLQQEGLITLKEGVGLEPTVDDITDNPKNFDIKELTANLLTTTLKDVDVAVINGNYAIGAGLKASDALAIESAEGDAAIAYGNVLAVKEGNEDNAAVKALVTALQSQQVKDYINANYDGGVVAMF